MKSYLLIFFGVVSVVPVIYILFTRNVVRAVFSMAASLLGLSGIYVLLNAEFMAVVQILIYVGGIIVLMVFGLMLTKTSQDAGFITTHRYPILGVAIAILFFFILSNMVSESVFTTNQMIPSSGNMVKLIGKLYLTQFIVAFELVAFLLLVALVGAAALAKKSGE